MAPKTNAKSIAYFTVVESDQTGWTGGLLVLNDSGRPLEFQCTLPVRPSKTHEILFGATLRGHLISEVIGALLVKKCRTSISMLCCDQVEALAIESVVDFPVVLLHEAAEQEEGPISADMIHGRSQLEFADSKIWVSAEREDDLQELRSHFDKLPDAEEPFSRIREAIFEAHSQIAKQRPPEAA